MPYICRSDFYKKTSVDFGDNEDWIDEFQASKSSDIPPLKVSPLIGYMDPVLDAGTAEVEIYPPKILDGPIDIYCPSRIFFIHPEIKSIIERLEPGIHDFLGMEVRYGRDTKERDFEVRFLKGDPFTTHPFFLCRINQHIDAVDVENSEGEYIEQPNGNKIFLKRSNAPVTLKKELIEGKHLWFYEQLFISDQLHDEIQKQRLGVGCKFEKQQVI